jgi:hypothetical protein
MLLFLGCGSTIRADIVYPARLELTQIDENTFEITFILPVIQGRILRATPLLPCSNLEDPVTIIDNFSKTMTWRVTCPELYGREVGLEGLGGSQVDILLRIEFLNGRIIQSTLSPARPIFVVPSPPTVVHTLIMDTLRVFRGFWPKLLCWFLYVSSSQPRRRINGCALGLYILAVLVQDWYCS